MTLRCKTAINSIIFTRFCIPIESPDDKEERGACVSWHRNNTHTHAVRFPIYSIWKYIILIVCSFISLFASVFGFRFDSCFCIEKSPSITFASHSFTPKEILAFTSFRYYFGIFCQVFVFVFGSHHSNESFLFCPRFDDKIMSVEWILFVCDEPFNRIMEHLIDSVRNEIHNWLLVIYIVQ